VAQGTAVQTGSIPPGRPRGRESRRRTHELLRLLAAGETLRDAARLAGVKAERVLRLLDDDSAFRAAVFYLLDARDSPLTC
jgi:hypothetical protein